MIKIWEWDKQPSFEEFCEFFGYDPTDESYWENYGEWSSENFDDEGNLVR
jgi:hypothetical protein